MWNQLIPDCYSNWSLSFRALILRVDSHFLKHVYSIQDFE